MVSQMVADDDSPQFDLTGDAVVDQADLNVWLALAGLQNLPTYHAYVPGDANLDGKVTSADLNIVALNWQQQAAGWCAADFNADGLIDSRDLNALALNWQHEIDVAEAANRARRPRAALARRAVISASLPSTVNRDITAAMQRATTQREITTSESEQLLTFLAEPDNLHSPRVRRHARVKSTRSAIGGDAECRETAPMSLSLRTPIVDWVLQRWL